MRYFCLKWYIYLIIYLTHIIILHYKSFIIYSRLKLFGWILGKDSWFENSSSFHYYFIPHPSLILAYIVYIIPYSIPIMLFKTLLLFFPTIILSYAPNMRTFPYLQNTFLSEIIPFFTFLLIEIFGFSD